MEDIGDCLYMLIKQKELMKQLEDNVVRAIGRNHQLKIDDAPLAELCRKMKRDISSLLLLNKKIEEITPSDQALLAAASAPRPSA